MNPREALLASLRDPHPPEVGWWPPAIGWWIVAALVLIGIASLLARRSARRRALAWQRAARAELVRLRERLDRDPPATLLAETSVLARRSLLAVSPRERVAPLHGDAWLEALDRASGGTRFTRGAPRRLASAPFERDPAVTRGEVAETLDALEALVTTLGSPPRERDGARR